MVGYALRGWRLALLAGGTFVWIAVLWPVEMGDGDPLGHRRRRALSILLRPWCWASLAWRYREGFEKILNPVLNIAQSLPHFAYMIPVVVFIGVGPKAGAIVTIIFSVPPMIRMTHPGAEEGPAGGDRKRPHVRRHPLAAAALRAA